VALVEVGMVGVAIEVVVAGVIMAAVTMAAAVAGAATEAGVASGTAAATGKVAAASSTITMPGASVGSAEARRFLLRRVIQRFERRPKNPAPESRVKNDLRAPPGMYDFELLVFAAAV
jgi:hypothetical protein